MNERGTAIPDLSTAHLDLLAIDDDALRELHRIAMIPEVRSSWRSRGTYIAPSQWAEFLMGRSLGTWMGVERATGTPIGCAEIYDASILDGYGYLGAFADPSVWQSGLPAELVLGCLQLAFGRYPLQKVLAHVPAINVERMKGVTRFAEEVGVLREHVLLDGERQDVTIYSLTRSAFQAGLEGPLGRCLSQVADRPRPDPPSAAMVEAAFDRWVELVQLEFSPMGESSGLDDLDSLHWLELVDVVESALGREVDIEALRACGSIEGIRTLLVDLAR